MSIKLIRNDDDYQVALTEIESLMGAESGTPELKRLDAVARLVEAYEAKHFPMEAPAPVEVIKFYMDQKGLEAQDLIPMIGPLSRVHEILGETRPLTPKIIKRLHEGLGIPTELLTSNIAPKNVDMPSEQPS